MEKLSFVLLFVLFSVVSFGQLKIGYVDSETIMNQLPDAADAQQRLDALIAEWQEELRNMENEWQTKLVALENKISNYRQQKFGPTGELFEKQTELMEPVQNKVFNVIQEVAEEEELDFVFDRSGDIIFLYAKPEYDITPLVLEKLEVDQVTKE